LFEDFLNISDENLEGALLANLATAHAKRLVTHGLHMVEIEFLDEPNQYERFFRFFGTDPSCMVFPIMCTCREGRGGPLRSVILWFGHCASHTQT